MPVWDDVERAALVALLRSRPANLTWSQIAAEVADLHSARGVWDRHQPQDLFGDGAEHALANALADVRQWQKAKFRFSTFLDEDYPAQLRDVRDFPPVLFTLGIRQSDERSVSVVGSRSASALGLRHATQLAQLLTAQQISVISGLAAGIDTAAHTATLEAGGRTVAIIGTGITRCYPTANTPLQAAIAHSGLVLSQFWPDSSGSQASFPMRNATMSAYGRATIVVEATEQSGARIQARLAVAHGRPVVLMNAVVHGTNWGAKLRGQPGVYVADSPRHAVDLVEEIIHSDDEIVDLLADLKS
jgi:DNA processing protein